MNSERRRRRAALPALLVALLGVLPAGCYEGDGTAFHDAVVVGSERVTGLAVSGGGTLIEVGATLQLVASGTTPTGTVDLSRDVTWTSSNPAAVAVGAGGLVTGVGNGSAVITATIAQFSASAAITASNALLTGITVSGAAAVDECGTGSYTATGHYDDGSNRDITALVGWSVTDSSIARMSTLAADRNTLFSKLAGSTGVVASRAGISNSPPFAVTVADNLVAIDVTPNTPAQLHEGDSLTFVATGNWGAGSVNISRATAWSVANDDALAPAIATVGNGDAGPGQLVAANGGTGTLTGSCGGLTDNVAITVVYLASLTITNTQPIVMAPNSTLLLALQGTYSDGSSKPLNESATWTVASVTGTPVTVSNAVGSRGLVTAGNASGTSTVTATVGSKSFGIAVTVQ